MISRTLKSVRMHDVLSLYSDLELMNHFKLQGKDISFMQEDLMRVYKKLDKENHEIWELAKPHIGELLKLIGIDK